MWDTTNHVDLIQTVRLLINKHPSKYESDSSRDKEDRVDKPKGQSVWMPDATRRHHPTPPA